MSHQGPLWQPTKAEIRDSCAEIQAEWSEQERAKRGGESRGWSIPQLAEPRSTKESD